MRLRIKYQILLIAMIPVFLMDVFFTYFHVTTDIHSAESLLATQAEITAKHITGSAEFSLLSGNYYRIQLLLDRSIGINEIIFIMIIDSAGERIAQSRTVEYDPKQSHEYLYYRYPIQTQNLDFEDIFQPNLINNDAQVRELGWIYLYISRQQLVQQKQKTIYRAIALFFGLLLIAVLLTLGISQRITRPIYRLQHHLNQIESGALGEIIHQREGNELGDLQIGFNSMSLALMENKTHLDHKIQTATEELREAIANLEYNNRELAIARDKAQQADRFKSQFLANMSHEIRTPINGIQGFLKLLINTELSPEQHRYAGIITRSTHDLCAIVSEILDFSKLESSNIVLHPQPFDLYDLLENTRDSLFASSLEKNIDLYLCIYSDTPRKLIGDSLRLKQILINLVGNAIKFTDSGFVSITVVMENETENQIMIKFIIEDSGIGIAEEDQRQIFQAFKQIETEANRRYTGTGLGLAISKDLARLMDGDIRLKSQPGSGSVFTLLIPFEPLPETSPETPMDAPKKVQTVMILAFNQKALNELQTLFERAGFETEGQLIDERSNPDSLRSQLQQNINYIDLIAFDLRHCLFKPDRVISPALLQQSRLIVVHYDPSLVEPAIYAQYPFMPVLIGCQQLPHYLNDPESINHPHTQEPALLMGEKSNRLLLVDDNPINLALASELSRLWGHSASEASDARQAMTLFNSTPFDLILLDIQMPEIDGIQLMNMMRDAQPELSTPIIAMTANAQESEKERLLALGFDAYISKPIDQSKLRRLLQGGNLSDSKSTAQRSAKGRQVSLDYALTLKLCADNKGLVESTLKLLRKEIPDYQLLISQALEEDDMQQMASIMHILQGVSCYAGLPALKFFLDEYESVKSEGWYEVIPLAQKINEELEHILQAITDQHTTGDTP